MFRSQHTLGRFITAFEPRGWSALSNVADNVQALMERQKERDTNPAITNPERQIIMAKQQGGVGGAARGSRGCQLAGGGCGGMRAGGDAGPYSGRGSCARATRVRARTCRAHLASAARR